jgi:hypothetical protein
MRVFISWAKDPSRVVADALRDWLPDVIQSLEPWVSSADVGAGARWSAEIAQALTKARIGIICVTADNQREPWLLFEAGALAKTLEDTFVCPYLIQMRPSDLAPGPLTQFQAKTANKDGTFDLISTINGALGSEALSAERLRRLFERCWPDLDEKLSALPAAGAVVQRDPAEIMSEVLETVRSLARRIPEPPPEPSPEEKAREKRRTKEFMIRRNLFLHGRPDPAIDMKLRQRLRKMPDDELDALFSAVPGLRRDEGSREVLEGLLAALLGSPQAKAEAATIVDTQMLADGTHADAD